MTAIVTREPPEGVLAGEDVPIENDRTELDEALVDELATRLREHPVHRHKSRESRREIARQKLRKWGDF